MTDNTSKIEERLSDSEYLKMDLKLYWRFWNFVFRKQWPVFACYAIFLVAMAALMPMFTLLWKRYLDMAAASEIPLVVGTLSLYLCLTMLLDFCHFFSMQFMDKINFSSWRVLDQAINRKAGSLHCEYMEIPNVQNRINRAWEFNHGSYIQMYQLGLETVRYFTQALGIFGSLYIIDPMVCWVSLLAIIPGIVSKIVRDKLSILNDRKLTDDENEMNYYKNAVFDQELLKDITLKNAFSFFENKYKVKAKMVFEREKSCEKKKTGWLLFEEVLRNLVILSCSLFACYQFLLGKTSLGGLAAVFSVIVI